MLEWILNRKTYHMMKVKTKHTIFHHKQLALTYVTSLLLRQIEFGWNKFGFSELQTTGNLLATIQGTKMFFPVCSSWYKNNDYSFKNLQSRETQKVLQQLNLPVSCGHRLTAGTADFHFSFHPYAEAKAGLIDTVYRSCSYLEPGPLWHTYVAKGRSCWTCSDWCQSC